MILTRRPFVVYDVDLIGLCAGLALVVIACTAIVRPALASTENGRRLGVVATQRQALLTAAEHQLLAAIADVERLKQAIERRRGEVPTSSSGESFLATLAQLGQRTEVLLSQVSPGAAKAIQGRRAVDITISASGSSRNLLAFMGELRRSDAYHVLLDYSITRNADAKQACQLHCTIRRFVGDAGAEGSTP
jgi:hypothetical protein